MSDNTKVHAERVAFEQGVVEGMAEAKQKIGEDVIKYAKQRGNAAGKAAISKEFRERIGFGTARVKALKAEASAHFDSLVAKRSNGVASGDVALDA